MLETSQLKFHCATPLVGVGDAAQSATSEVNLGNPFKRDLVRLVGGSVPEAACYHMCAFHIDYQHLSSEQPRFAITDDAAPATVRTISCAHATLCLVSSRPSERVLSRRRAIAFTEHVDIDWAPRPAIHITIPAQPQRGRKLSLEPPLVRLTTSWKPAGTPSVPALDTHWRTEPTGHTRARDVFEKL